MALWQRSVFALVWAAFITLPFLMSTPKGRAQDKKGKGSGEKTPQGTVVKNTSGQVVGPTGVFNVKKAELTWLEKDTREGNARITVEFHSKPASNAVDFEYNHQTVTLKDNGKGAYSGLLRVDTSDLTDKVGDVGKKAVPPFKRLIFDGRHVVEEQKVDTIKPLQFTRGDTIDLLGSPACNADTDIAQSLMITDPKVVDDPTRTYNPITDSGNGNGPWSFGHIMTVLANPSQTGITPEAFTRRWLARWEHDQIVNDFTVEKRPNIKQIVIDLWPRLSGTDNLDLAKAPFRLLAIVNRLDLRDNFLFETPPAALTLDGVGGLGGSKATRQPQVPRASPGGEARMVFGLVDRRKSPPVNAPFTVIFEFGVFLDQCRDIRSWADQWYKLKNDPIDSPAYRHNLTLITKQFIQPAQDAAKPERLFALNQVRTNEIALVLPALGPGAAPPFWELREFRIAQEDSDKGHLREVTVKQTPNNRVFKKDPDGTPMPDPNDPEDLNLKQVIADYVNANASTLLVNTHIVPLQFPPGQAFLGGRSLTLTAAKPKAMPPELGFFWNAPTAMPKIMNNDARHHFSLNTCNGCHGGETQTPAFVMISPTDTEANGAAKLAPFLTGVSFPDPVDGQIRTFNDLSRRKTDLDRIVCLPCFYQLFHRPIRMTH